MGFLVGVHFLKARVFQVELRFDFARILVEGLNIRVNDKEIMAVLAACHVFGQLLDIQALLGRN